ncbi:hypothetical protein [Coleofasciculus sp. FACHB-129]|uniref:hypothetical protein n=1 Tax=Cyanophyceae TaxID=3028117 RepID=UPI001685C8F7|nr:hypothetical protein [Coleofasciculus sp. FACHB-129]MBD1896105.1 hypothetical protein [Coleofasciculus sp. FACHB-129]
MQHKIVWEQGSNNPDNTNNFATIREWWASLIDNKITWRQRIIPQTGDATELDWEPQRFDEVFEIQIPEIRGITLYWRKINEERERSTTPTKLELDTLRQQLYIYPQSQKELVIRVGIPETIYQKIEFKSPQLQFAAKEGENHILTLRDTQQQLEVKAILSPENLRQLIDQLKQQLS